KTPILGLQIRFHLSVFGLLKREVLKRVNPSPSSIHSYRESEWAKAEDVLKAATRCSRKTESIRGALFYTDNQRGREEEIEVNRFITNDV
ncbi:hypothetical protein H5410_014843, partial [Solanum commersonii]